MAEQSRRDFLRALGAGAAAVAPQLASQSPGGEARAKRPNILFLISDDQRYDTIGALGNRTIRTPNLDALVRGGVTFTRPYIMGSNITTFIWLS